MDWEHELSGWAGRLAEIRIEDQAGHDPVAPPKTVLLHRVKLDGSVLAFYINDQQFVSVPLFDDSRTRLTGKTFESADAKAQLIYKVALL